MARRSALVLLAGVLVLGLIHYTIYQRERILRDGAVLLLELAPVDPRALLQGDYMALRFALADRIRATLPDRRARNGRVIVRVGTDRVATFARLDDGRPLAEGELRLRYRVRAQRVRLATNAYFFEEGSAARYGGATHGEFRVATDGEAILTHLRDRALQRL